MRKASSAHGKQLNDGTPRWGWGIRQPPSQVTERQGGFTHDFLQPLLMAILLAAATVFVWVAFLNVVRQARAHTFWICALAFSAGNIGWSVLLRARWELHPRYFISGLAMGLFASVFSVALWKVAGFDRKTNSALAMFVGACALVFWLTISFGLESVLRSPAMEEHGFRELFGFVFGLLLPERMKREPEPAPAVVNKRLPPIARSANGTQPLAMGSAQGAGSGETYFEDYLALFLTHSVNCGNLVDDRGEPLDPRGCLTRDVLTGHPMPDGSVLKVRQPANSAVPGWEEYIAYLEALGAIHKPGRSWEWVANQSAGTVLTYIGGES